MASDIPYPLLMSIQKATMAHRYRGVEMLKNPFDLALYPLLLAQARPRTLIEIGSHRGGSALWLADTAAALGLSMRVLSIDLVRIDGVQHPAVTFLQGDAGDLGAVLANGFVAALPRPLLVIEDSDHAFGTCRAVLTFFDRWLEPGEYIVVEDGILTDMRVAELYDGGPLRAIHEFLGATGGRYVVDRDFCDYFGRNVTWNVDGYLRRV
jgi:cephalosporin hydroxylase